MKKNTVNLRGTINKIQELQDALAAEKAVYDALKESLIFKSPRDGREVARIVLAKDCDAAVEFTLQRPISIETLQALTSWANSIINEGK